MKYLVDIQAVEDALLQGRKLIIGMEFVTNEDGEPAIDLAVYEDEHLIGSSLNCESMEDALNMINYHVRQEGANERPARRLL